MLKPYFSPEPLPPGCPSRCSDAFARVYDELHGRVSIYIASARCAVFLEGDCTPNEAVADIMLCLEQGLVQPATEVFVDLTDFSGTVDWGFVGTIPKLAIWKPPPQKMAFLVGSEPLAVLAKVVGVFVNNTKSKTFTDPYEAHAWLGWLD